MVKGVTSANYYAVRPFQLFSSFQLVPSFQDSISIINTIITVGNPPSLAEGHRSVAARTQLCSAPGPPDRRGARKIPIPAAAAALVCAPRGRPFPTGTRRLLCSPSWGSEVPLLSSSRSYGPVCSEARSRGLHDGFCRWMQELRGGSAHRLAVRRAAPLRPAQPCRDTHDSTRLQRRAGASYYFSSFFPFILLLFSFLLTLLETRNSQISAKPAHGGAVCARLLALGAGAIGTECILNAPALGSIAEGKISWSWRDLSVQEKGKSCSNTPLP